MCAAPAHLAVSGCVCWHRLLYVSPCVPLSFRPIESDRRAELAEVVVALDVRLLVAELDALRAPEDLRALELGELLRDRAGHRGRRRADRGAGADDERLLGGEEREHLCSFAQIMSDSVLVPRLRQCYLHNLHSGGSTGLTNSHADPTL